MALETAGRVGNWNPDGFGAYLEERKAPTDRQDLVAYLAKYGVSPPISLRCLLGYDGQHVWCLYRDYKSGKRQVAELPVLRFIGRVAQPILPKGFHRIRYCGLHVTGQHQRVKLLLKTIWVAMGQAIKGMYRVVRRQSCQGQVLASTGRDPLCCLRCGGPLMLWQVWHPRYGAVHDELEQIKRGRYAPGGIGLRGGDVAWGRRAPKNQLGWSLRRVGEAIRLGCRAILPVMTSSAHRR